MERPSSRYLDTETRGIRLVSLLADHRHSHLGERPLAGLRIGARGRRRRNLLRHLRGRRAGGQVLPLAAAGEYFHRGEIYGRATAWRRRRVGCGCDWLRGIRQAGRGLAGVFANRRHVLQRHSSSVAPALMITFESEHSARRDLSPLRGKLC
jgi:hypothetical protein